MRLHRRGEHLRRNLEKALVEGAHEHDRPFGEPGILGEQGFVLDERQALLGGERAGVLQNIMPRSLPWRMTRASSSFAA